MPTTTKKIYYLRARHNNKPKDIQALIEIARSKKSTVASSEIKFGAGDIVRIQHYKNKINLGIFLHLTRYVPGEKAPTLQPKVSTPEDHEGTQRAPAGKEFKDGECFLLVSQHHVFYCGHGIHLSKAANYLSQLFESCEIDKDLLEFDISPVSNLDKVKLLQKHGVKSILLSSNAFDISLPDKKRKNWISKCFGKLSDEIKALLEKDDTVDDQKAREDLLVNIELRLDGNTRAAQDSQKFIEDIAESVLEDTDAPINEFSIVTQTGETIKQSSIRLQKSYKLPIKDRSISHSSAWESMGKYLRDIKKSGLLEQ